MQRTVLNLLTALALVTATSAMTPAQTSEPHDEPSWWTVTDQYGQDIIQVADSTASEAQFIAYAGGVSIDILATLNNLDERLRAYEQANPLPTDGPESTGPTPRVAPTPTMTPSWMDSFTQNQHPTMPQCEAWRTWIEDDLPSQGFDSLTAWSSYGTTFTCSDGNVVAAIAARLKNDQQQGQSRFTCGSNTWAVSSCGWVNGSSGPFAVSLQVTPASNNPPSGCVCNKFDLSIAPCMNAYAGATYSIAGWGGGSRKDCNAPSQTLFVSFDLAPTPAPTPDPTPAPPTPRTLVPYATITKTLSSRRMRGKDAAEE